MNFTFYCVNEISDYQEFFRDESHLNVMEWKNSLIFNWESYKISKDK